MKIASPCTKVCFIDPSTGFCEGCYRSLEEIGRWSSFTEEERDRIVLELDFRKTSVAPNLD